MPPDAITSKWEGQDAEALLIFLDLDHSYQKCEEIGMCE